MTGFFKKAALAASLLAAGAMAATPAQARDRYDRRGDNGAAVAIGAGIVGLAIGAAIAGSNNRDRRYDDRYYYQPRTTYYPRYRTYNYPVYRERYVYRDQRRYDRHDRYDRRDHRDYRRRY